MNARIRDHARTRTKRSQPYSETMRSIESNHSSSITVCPSQLNLKAELIFLVDIILKGVQYGYLLFSLENVVKTSTDSDFNRVPAVDKCFRILDLTASSKRSFGINGTSKRRNLKKSSAYNIVQTLIDLQMLGLKAQAGADRLSQLSELLILVAMDINDRLSPIQL